MGRVALLLAYCLGFVWVLHSRAEQCGSQAGGALCPGGLCCSRFGWCGSTAPYCDRAQGCQSQCWGLTLSPPPPLRSSPPPPPRPSPPPPPRPSPPPPPRPPPPPPPPSQPPSGGVASIISQTLFDQMLLHRNDAACPARNFYTYNAFITAANSFPAFGTTGDLATRKREIAAFFGQTSHETTGGWATAPDGPYSWGYCFKEELGNPGDYCQPSTQWPCVSGKKYYGRGPVQISYNYNYGPAGQAIGVNLLNNPDLVASDPAVSFKTALWFWMTPQSPKPSSHSVITGGWTPSAADVAAGRQPGYGVITNIINGGLECGRGPDGRVADRIGFYDRYCGILGVSPGANLDCYTQAPFS